MRASKYIVSSSALATWCSERKWSRIRTSSTGRPHTLHGTRDRRMSESRELDDCTMRVTDGEGYRPTRHPGAAVAQGRSARFNWEPS